MKYVSLFRGLRGPQAVRRSLFVVTSNFLIDIDKYKVRFDENNYIVPGIESLSVPIGLLGFHSACPGKESNPQAEPPSSSAEKQNKCVHHEADDRKYILSFLLIEQTVENA